LAGAQCQGAGAGSERGSGIDPSHSIVCEDLQLGGPQGACGDKAVLAAAEDEWRWSGRDIRK